MSGWLVAAAGMVALVVLAGLWEVTTRWVVARQQRREVEERARMRREPPVLGDPERARHLRNRRWT
jgi:hypothetical protein